MYIKQEVKGGKWTSRNNAWIHKRIWGLLAVGSQRSNYESLTQSLTVKVEKACLTNNCGLKESEVLSPNSIVLHLLMCVHQFPKESYL